MLNEARNSSSPFILNWKRESQVFGEPPSTCLPFNTLILTSSYNINLRNTLVLNWQKSQCPTDYVNSTHKQQVIKHQRKTTKKFLWEVDKIRDDQFLVFRNFYKAKLIVKNQRLWFTIVFLSSVGVQTPNSINYKTYLHIMPKVTLLNNLHYFKIMT